jgi:hypothetical protein
VVSLVLSYVSRGISSSKYFSSETSIKKTRIEAPRVAYFFQTTNLPTNPQETHQRADLIALRACLELIDYLTFYFCQKFAKKRLRKQGFPKQAL